MVVDAYDSDTLNEVTHRNIALSRIAYGRGEVPIDVIARSFNLSVFDYNREVIQTQHHCISNATSFIELRV